MKWWAIGIMGAAVLVLFGWLLSKKKEQFDGALLGLLTLGLGLVAIAILQPQSLKFGSVELNQIRNISEQASADAERARKLSAETTAFLFWNGGRLNRTANEFQQGIARQVLKEVYGDKTDELIRALQHEKVFVTAPQKLKLVPKAKIPSDIGSPMLTRMGEWTEY